MNQFVSTNPNLDEDNLISEVYRYSMKGINNKQSPPFIRTNIFSVDNVRVLRFKNTKNKRRVYIYQHFEPNTIQGTDEPEYVIVQFSTVNAVTAENINNRFDITFEQRFNSFNEFIPLIKQMAQHLSEDIPVKEFELIPRVKKYTDLLSQPLALFGEYITDYAVISKAGETFVRIKLFPSNLILTKKGDSILSHISLLQEGAFYVENNQGDYAIFSSARFNKVVDTTGVTPPPADYPKTSLTDLF